MKNAIIKVGFCVSYDWEMLKTSVPLVYTEADTICFSIDKYRKTWNGQPYDFDEDAFRAWVTSVDPLNKITILEDEFSNTQHTAIQNDNLQRNAMGKAMGAGGWHIQIDADEYFIDFPGFVQTLLAFNPSPTGQEKPVNFYCNLLPVIKRLEDGYLLAINEENHETFPVATNVPVYEYARRNGHFNHYTPFFVIHETWSRDEEQLWKKLNNWGHRDDFNLVSYFALWKTLDSFNYRFIRNFHPVEAAVWEKLEYFPAAGIGALTGMLKNRSFQVPGSLVYLTKNSRVVQGLLHRVRKLKK
ncbi:MAG: hypothetical protein EOO04_17535 [Chitinophagaceae bacterium]|nr:MAG: hypothetical protein EOO04_17535 [Chitinophagaceae bacterium]